MEGCGYGVLCRSVIPVCKLVKVKREKRTFDDVASDQFLKTFCNDWSESHRMESFRLLIGVFFGTGMRAEDFR